MKRNVQYIISMSVNASFLENMELVFSAGLNCIIGARGTGKTTALEFIRYDLNALGPEHSEVYKKKQFDDLMKTNLGTGRIWLTIKTANGLEFVVDRTATGDSIISSGDSVKNQLSINLNNVFPVDIYGQNEIEHIADSPSSQLVLLDNFKREEIGALNSNISRLRHELLTNSSLIIPLEKQLAGMREELNLLPGIEQKIASLSAQTGVLEKDTLIETAHRNRSLRALESAAAINIVEFLPNVSKELISIIDKFRHQIESQLTPEIRTGPNGELITRIYNELQRCLKQLQPKLLGTRDEVEKTRSVLNDELEKLKIVHEKQELEFRDIVEKNIAAKGLSAEREQMEQRKNELLLTRRKSDELSSGLARLKQVRQDMLSELSRLEDERFNIRNKIAEYITENVAQPMRVEVFQYGNRDQYENLLSEILKGSGIHYRSVVTRVAASISPHELVEFVRSRNCERIQVQSGINSDQARTLVQRVDDPQLQLELESVELADLPSIQLKDGEEFKDTLHLSTGQKCTAILPILLLVSGNPLLIDQPEDNLDNRFIFETIVDAIIKAKKHRQMIFITHNPNIPVLADADKVFVFASDGTKAWVANSGSVDDCKEDIINLLEGGREAFERRKERYGK